MNAWTPTPPQTPPADAPPCGQDDEAAAVAARHLRMLDQLAEIGMALAVEIGRQVTAQPPVVEDEASPPAPRPSLNDLALGLSRASRAVRMSIALYARLTAGPRGPQEGPATLEDLLERLDAGVSAHRGRIEDVVERVAIAGHDDEQAVERLTSEAAERLEREAYGDIMARPVSEVVDLICRDLGLSPDWPALAQEAWARREIDSGQVGRPLAGMVAVTPNNLPSPPGLSRGPRVEPSG